MKLIFISFAFHLLFSSCQESNHSKSEIESGSKNEKQKSIIVNPAFPVKDLFGIWTTDPDGPHADFVLNENSFYVVGYDGNGDFNYEINDNKISIYYPGKSSANGSDKQSK